MGASLLNDRWVLAAAVFALAIQATGASAQSVINSHPRLLLTAAEKTRLMAKKNANDPSWLALKARADSLAAYRIHPYKFDTSSDAPENTIYYTYQGEGWIDAVMPLAFAYQMTG